MTPCRAPPWPGRYDPGVKRSPREGMTLVEAVTATAILAVAVLAFGLTLSTSMTLTRTSVTAHVAQQAAGQVIERARALPIDQAWTLLWATRGIEVAPDGAVVEDAGGVLRAVRAEVVDPAIARGTIAPPGDGRSMLTLRLLSEAQHAAMWGVVGDLDLDGAVSALLPAAGRGDPPPASLLLSMVVEVRWREASGERVYALPTVLSPEAPLSDDREVRR